MNIDNVKLLKSKVQKAAAFFRPLIELDAALDEVLDLGAVVAKAEQDKANLAAELESIRQETTEAIAKRQEVNAEAERIIADAREAGKKVAREAIDGARAVIDDMAKEEEEKVKYLDKLTSSCLEKETHLSRLDSQIALAEEKLASLNAAIEAGGCKVATTLNFKDYIDLPEWKTLANAPSSWAAGASVAFDMRSDISRHPFHYFLRSSSYLDMYSPLMDDWMVLGSPALAGTFGAGACAVFVPSHGPRGTIGTGATTTSVLLSSGLPASVGPNQLANRGDGVGFKIRIIDNAPGASGKVEDRFITYNSGGSSNITVGLDSALSFTPASGSAFEILSGRVYLLSAGTLASGIFKYYDVATNSFSTSLATTGLPSSIATDTDMVALDEQYTPTTRALAWGSWGFSRPPQPPPGQLLARRRAATLPSC